MTVKVVGVLNDSYVDKKTGALIQSREVYYTAETRKRNMQGVRAGVVALNERMFDVTDIRVGDLYCMEKEINKWNREEVVEFYPLTPAGKGA